jgi:hypothetical protein
MSKYEWEHGKLTLPTAEVAKLKKVVRDAILAHRSAVQSELDRFWERYGRSARSDNAWWAALERWESETARRLWSSPQYPAREDASCILHDTPCRKPTKAALDRVLGPAPTNRTAVFDIGEVQIAFTGRHLSWSVSENNHAVERAHDHPVARALFSALGRLNWTRGTGGVFVGNDEYNRDADYAGGGANYVTASFGPLGDARNPRHLVHH